MARFTSLRVSSATGRCRAKRRRIERRGASFSLLSVTLASLAFGCGDSTEPSGQPIPAQISIQPDTATILVDSLLTLSVTALDAEGRRIEGLRFDWSSSARGIAAVDDGGVVQALAVGNATITASYESLSASARIDVWPLVSSFTLSRGALTMVPLSASRIAVTVLDAEGDTVANPAAVWRSSDPDVVDVSQGGGLWANAEGESYVVASAYGHADSALVTVSYIEITDIALGTDHACGLTSEGDAFCWGQGPLGHGPAGSSPAPVQVAGGHRFARLAAGNGFTCGVTEEGGAYCWGAGDWGQLGHGHVVESSLTPVRVTGDERFVGVACGDNHACGVTAGGAAYCWGSDRAGRLGDGLEWDGLSEPQPVPRPVVGGHSFVSVTAAYRHTCGLSASGEAFCWGDNFYGALGNGEGSGVYSSPVAAVSGRTFKRISAGYHDFTCGVTAADTLLCWGHNDLAQLGRGTQSSEELSPESPIGLSLAIAVDGAVGHSCALALDGTGHCWGVSGVGQGDGDLEGSLAPSPVAGVLSFKAIGTAGGNASCAVTTDNRAYCWGWNFMYGDDEQLLSVPTLVVGQRSAP